LQPAPEARSHPGLVSTCSVCGHSKGIHNMLTAMEVLSEVSEFPTSPEQRIDFPTGSVRLSAWNSVDVAFSIPAVLVITWCFIASW
jgi:hypothetical protein